MLQDRSFLVVLVAAVTGVLLARAAGAVIDAHAPVAAALPAVVRATASAPAPTDHGPARTADATSAAMRVDGEPEEPHSDSVDENPYEEMAPPRGSPSRLSVPLRDGMLKLPGGHFAMGSANPRAPANERPVRTVTVSPFWIDRTEVTVDAYRACVEGRVVRSPRPRERHVHVRRGRSGSLRSPCVHWSDADGVLRVRRQEAPDRARVGIRGARDARGGLPLGSRRRVAAPAQ